MSQTMLTNAAGNIPSRPSNEPQSHSLLICFRRTMRLPALKLKSSAASPEKSYVAIQYGRPPPCQATGNINLHHDQKKTDWISHKKLLHSLSLSNSFSNTVSQIYLLQIIRKNFHTTTENDSALSCEQRKSISTIYKQVTSKRLHIFFNDFAVLRPQTFYGPFSGTIRLSRCQKRTSGLYSARED